MAKLVEILARELNEWPEDACHIGQARDGTLHLDDAAGNFIRHTDESFTLCDDFIGEYVTRDQWKAERARIAANQQATTEAREISRTGSMTSEEQELAAIACGKRSKEDQALWDKVAVAAIGGVTASDAFHNYANFQGNPDIAAAFAVQVADAFMAERAKRIAAKQ